MTDDPDVESVRSRALSTTSRLRVHAIPLSDDDGGRAYSITVADLTALISTANTRLAALGVELVFDPTCDWAPLPRTSLNSLVNTTPNFWVEPNQVASRIPGKIVMFFRFGNHPTKPTGNGFAYPPATGHPVPSSAPLPTDDVQFVAFPSTKAGIEQNDGNFFAHEVGHYLGLFHTFPGWGTETVYPPKPGSPPPPLTSADAEQRLVSYIQANGGTEAALDGDLLGDTAPDCGAVPYDAAGWAHGAADRTTVTFEQSTGSAPYDFTFTPPRDNAMSYFTPGRAQTFTAQQRQRVQETLQHDRRRRLSEWPCPPDFHDLEVTRFQGCFDYWVHRCRWPHTLGATFTGGQVLMAGSFQPGPDRPVRHLMTSAQYQSSFEQFRELGFRPARVVGTPTPGGPRYTAIWTPIDGDFEARHVLPLDEYEHLWHDFRTQGWLQVDLSIYATTDGPRAASVWVQRPFDDYASYFGMTASEYQQRFEDLWERGLRVTTFSAYRDGDDDRYAAIWERVPGRWGHWFGLTSSEYQQKYDEMAAAGLRLHQVQLYGATFSGIWTG